MSEVKRVDPINLGGDVNWITKPKTVPHLGVTRVHERLGQPIQDGLKVYHEAVGCDGVFTDLQPRSFDVQVDNPREIL